MSIRVSEEVIEYVKKKFRELKDRVNIYFFESEECETCDQIAEILDLLKGLSPKITVRRLSSNSPEAKRFSIDLFPAILIHGREEYNVRYFGAPLGYEFGVIVEDIVDASRGEPKLRADLLEKVRREVNRKVRIMVFVTPTCPYCPRAVRAAHKMAMANRNIYSDGIEALEFRDLAEKYDVFAVPKTVVHVDDEPVVEFEGALPDTIFIERVINAVKLARPR